MLSPVKLVDLDDRYPLTVEEFCLLTGVDLKTVETWRQNDTGPRWERFQGVGRHYVTAAEARRFLRLSARSTPLGEQ